MKERIFDPLAMYTAGFGEPDTGKNIENLEWAKGKVLTHNGSNGIWFATVLVAPKIERAYVVVTNSRDFSFTSDICSKTINKLIKLDLNNNN